MEISADNHTHECTSQAYASAVDEFLVCVPKKKDVVLFSCLQVQKQSKLRGEYITMMYDEDDDVLADGGK